MKILAIDTSTMISSVAILEDEYCLAEYSLNQVKTHSELLLPMTKALLENLGLELKDMDLFAVAKGPGSFTGLRIGMSAVKSIAQVLDKKIVGVSTLEALAYGVMTDRFIMPLIDARGKRFFAGIYRWDKGKLVVEKEDGLYKATDIIEFLKESKEEYVIVGDGLNIIKDDLLKIDHVWTAHAGLNNCVAINIAQIAKNKAQKGDYDSYFDLAPNYIRKSQAELDYEKKHC